MKFITRVLSLKYNKYVTRENNRKFKSPNEVAKHNTLGMLSEMSSAENTRLFKIAWFYFFRRVTARDELNRHEIKFAW